VNLKGQHIGRVFTFLAGLIISAHAVVPHHHHFEVTHSPKQESNCESSSQGEGDDNQDFHCRAFNILVSERTTSSSVNQSLPECISLYFTGLNVNIAIPPVKNITSTVFSPQAVFLKQFFISAQSLRAPPEIS
jgi:hypothetical protein